MDLIGPANDGEPKPPPPAVKSDADFRFDEGRVYYTAQVGLELPVTVPIPFSTLKYMAGYLLTAEAGHVLTGKDTPRNRADRRRLDRG